MKGFSRREIGVVLISVFVSVAFGTLIALGLAILLGGRPTHWEWLDLAKQIPAALLFGLATSVAFSLPLGMLGGVAAVLALRSPR